VRHATIGRPVEARQRLPDDLREGPNIQRGVELDGADQRPVDVEDDQHQSLIAIHFPSAKTVCGGYEPITLRWVTSPVPPSSKTCSIAPGGSSVTVRRVCGGRSRPSWCAVDGHTLATVPAKRRSIGRCRWPLTMRSTCGCRHTMAPSS